MQQHPYIGRWVSLDGSIRQDLRADGRFSRARSDGAADGAYTVAGTRLHCTADDGDCDAGRFDGEVLEYGGTVLYRDA